MTAKEAYKTILEYAPNHSAKLGIILGSGLSSFAEQIQDPIKIPYAKIPGIPAPSIQGHSGNLLLGKIHGVPVACLQGRLHLYEGAQYHDIRTLVRVLKLLGCEQLIVTNAAGSLREDVGPGEISLITDHINMQGGNPLIGPNNTEFGERFIAMEDTYDLALRQSVKETANDLQMNLHEGVYIAVLGPMFETPAEIRAFRILGADLVGMSTVPEVIVARHCGIKVVGLSIVTNLAAGMSPEKLSHDGTLHYSNLASEKLSQLITHYIHKQAKAYV